MGSRLKQGRKNSPPEKRTEQGAVLKTGKGLLRTALVYPNTYQTGMSSLGFQTVYTLINQLDSVACERVFLPDKKTGAPVPASEESGLPLHQFDIIFFSISFENDFIHIAQLLVQSGIPLRSSDRNHTHPLVIAGGVACFLNPQPIAPFIDCFLLGEAECLLKPFFDLFFDTPGRPLLTTIESSLPGAYVPSLHTANQSFQITVQYLETLKDTITTSCILTRDAVFKDLFLIEILKGCPHGCRFCSAGFIYRPPRVYPLENICTAIESASGRTDKIGLVSSAIADHPDIDSICSFAITRGFQLSFSSLRADLLNDDLVQALSRSKVKTATIAPEAGSERMRQTINKQITEPDILSAAQRLVAAGIMNLKLYFMIGLPFETDRDVQAIVDLTLKIKAVFLEASRKQKKMGTITLSLNPFIPKPATPFQWSAMAEETILKHRIRMIQDGLKKIANIKINVESLRQARIHALLSRGDVQCASVIETALENGWPAALRQHKAYCDQVVYHPISPEKTLPWDFLNNRINKHFLLKEYRRASRQKPSPACPMIDCARCKTCIA